jgi:hypothetical protein
VYIERISREDWLNVPDKTTQARPAQFYVERTNIPKVYFYPAPDQGTPLCTTASAAFRTPVATPTRPTSTSGSCRAWLLAWPTTCRLKFAADRTVALKAIYEEDFQRAAWKIETPPACSSCRTWGYDMAFATGKFPTDCATTADSATSTTYCARTGAGSWSALTITSPRSRNLSPCAIEGLHRAARSAPRSH